jgi:hypothetical protein
MNNQKWTTALLVLVLPILGACSSPVTLETNTASSPKTLQAKATPNIVPNDVWNATHGFQLRAYYDNASTFSTTQNGVTITVAYTYNDVFESEDMRFVPGTQANTLTSLEFKYISTKHQIALIKTTRPQISGPRNCTYSLGPQEFLVPAESITLVFDPTNHPNPSFYPAANIPKDWITAQAITGYEVTSVTANLQSVCQGPMRGQTTTTQTPVTLFRTAQPTRPIIQWQGLFGPDWCPCTSPALIDISFGTHPSGWLHIWR